MTWQQDKGTDVKLSESAVSKTDAKGEARIVLTSTTKAVENIQVSAQLADGKVINVKQTVNFVVDTVTVKIQIKSLM